MQGVRDDHQPASIVSIVSLIAWLTIVCVERSAVLLLKV